MDWWATFVLALCCCGLRTLSAASRLSGQGTGSPCYMLDQQGQQDLQRPQVAIQHCGSDIFLWNYKKKCLC